MALVNASESTSPLHLTPQLRWLLRGRPPRIATPCRLPDCPKLVPKDKTVEPGDRNTRRAGARGWFCSDRHRTEYRARRKSLVDAIEALERQLAQTGLSRRTRSAAESDLTYLRKVLVTYAEVRATVHAGAKFEA